MRNVTRASEEVNIKISCLWCEKVFEAMESAEVGNLIVWGGISLLFCALLHALFRIFSDGNGLKAEPPVTSAPSRKPTEEKEEETPGDSAEPKTGKSKKRPAYKNKNDYSHPWLLKTLKGHPGPVLDMGFSSNGKYLASTCQEAVEPVSTPLTSVPSPVRRRKARARIRPESPPCLLLAPPAPPPRLTVDELHAALWPYLLTPHQMWVLGYPVELEPNSNKAALYVSAPPRPPVSTFYDVNAPEFVPSGSGSCSASDSGHGSGGSSPHADSDEEAPGADHTCVRCGSFFRICADGEYRTLERCRHHWGRLTAGKFSCCDMALGSPACSSARLHVWNGTRPGMNVIEGYVRARTRRGGVFSIDAEMCYTTAGLELASVAVVGVDGRLVYKATVKPRAPVIDYNTRFSGIRQRDLDRATKTLRDVQNDILGFVGSDTILVGHALENDLRALKLLHCAVVDTCALYPHERGFPMRRSLRALAAEHLGRAVQTGPHSPLEDARAALDLVLVRLDQDRADAAR